MTDTRPLRCDYDRDTGQRLTRAGDPCEHDHCVLCRARHTDDAHPLVCPTCVGGIREDLVAVVDHTRALRGQAIDGSSAGGQLLAAAPIPGGDAMVLLGPSGDRETAAHRWDSATRGRLVKSKTWAHYADDHRPKDLEPPLSLLASWEDTWRRHLQTETQRRATITSAVDYFDRNLTLMAQLTEGPDIVAFARDIAGLRARLEAVLHDEHTPERGVECFECGVRLVRRIRDRQGCTHKTPARGALAKHMRRRPAAIAWLQVLATYPELGYPTRAEREAALLPSPAMVTAARLPCEKCARRGQGGVDDPTPGLSWECPGCRKKYTPGEYATAVRRDLMESEDAYGWTDITLAATAATTLTGYEIPASTVRKWMDRGQIASVCTWNPGQRWGVRLVFWPDVAASATAGVERALKAAEARARRAAREGNTEGLRRGA